MQPIRTISIIVVGDYPGIILDEFEQTLKWFKRRSYLKFFLNN